jgi:hypothetical protein
MKAAVGILILNNKEYKILELDYDISRKVDINGKPSNQSTGFYINLSIESDSDTSLFDWAIGNETKDGTITFYKPDGMSKFLDIKFKKAYCIAYHEKFRSSGTMPMHQIITILEPRREPENKVIALPKRVVQTEKLETKVKTIQLMTTLDLGSANDNSGTETQEGMLYGNTYEFKVVAFTEETPADKSIINWMYKYHSLSENKWIEKKLAVTGDTLKFTLNEKDMCGRVIHMRAYIKDPENEGELKVWKHNRFRWFDRKKVHNQIKNRINDPWKINQAQTSLCGMAALYYAMIKRDAKAYEKLAKELFRTGEYSIGSYVIKPHEKALSMYEVNTSYDNYIALKMAEIDWIVLATTRSKESLNSQFVYNGFENDEIDMLKGANWPEMLTRMCKEVAGFTSAEAIDLGMLQISNKKGISGKLNDAIGGFDIMHLKIIDRKYKQGHTILMMIDSDMIKDKVNYDLKALTTNVHWVVYEGGLSFVDVGESKFVGFSIYTWGFDPVNQKDEWGKEDEDKKPLIYGKERISIESFKSNYYGYIEVY